MREIFEDSKRTEHKGVPPARDRIKSYKVKGIKRNVPSAFPTITDKKSMHIQSQPNIKAVPSSAKEIGLLRPTTAVVPLSEAPTAVTSNALSQSMQGLAALNNKAISISRFSKFEESEKAKIVHPYPVFYTSNEPTTYHQENRFEGKSTYMAYYPTGLMQQQEIENLMCDYRNKELADKRRDEEAKQIMKDWGQARGRMESEIARKKEHLNVATNFEEARGWVRKNWKTKNHNH